MRDKRSIREQNRVTNKQTCIETVDSLVWIAVRAEDVAVAGLLTVDAEREIGGAVDCDGEREYRQNLHVKY